MLAIVFIILSLVLGRLLIAWLAPKYLQESGQLAGGFLLGNFLTTWFAFLIAASGISLNLAVATALVITLIITGILFKNKKRKWFFLRFSKADAIILFLSLLIGSWLMTQTLGYQDSKIMISKDIWNDMELHLPLARSFSWGKNIPPESPFFPNKNLAYHFLFDFEAGILESLGMRLDQAFNLLGSLSFAALLIVIFELSQKIFKKSFLLGGLSVFLFIFHSSFGILDALKKIEPNSFFNFLRKIWQSSSYLSVGPFQDDLVSICWNLNVYVNQRHLVFTAGLGITILLIFLSLVKNKDHRPHRFILLGLAWGLIPLWYTHIFIGLGLILATFLILNKNHRLLILMTLVIGSLLALPQLFWLTKDVKGAFAFQPGFLTTKPLTLTSFVSYWFFNLGLASFTIPLGFLLANLRQKKLFLSFLSIFFVANLFQFNQEMFNNHKFFNFWLMLTNIYSAFFLTTLIKKRWFIKVFAIILLFLLSVSGLVDLMVIKNKNLISLPDWPKDKAVLWLKNNTPPKANFLAITDQMYHPVRMAGRKTYLIWPRYAWAYGYDIKKREKTGISFFQTKDPKTLKNNLLKNNLDYVIIPKTDLEKIELSVNRQLWQNYFRKVYEDQRFEIFFVQ
ncbi:hypothetical protein ACFL0Y_03190 [Patescibacteria group bacterium]